MSPTLTEPVTKEQLPEAWKPFAAPVVTADQIELIKRTVANGATADELKLYLYDCARQGVHPLDKLIHFTKRDGRYTPITSIDFMRCRAADTGEYAGSDDATFTGTPKEDGWEAHVTVWRLVRGVRCPFTATARWSEYKPDAGASGKGDRMWQRMPHTMLAKCAEALALRKGFPRQLAGLYAKEELDQADRPASQQPIVSVEAPSTPPAGGNGAVASVPNAGDSGHLNPRDFHSTQNQGANPADVITIRKVDTNQTKTGARRYIVVFSDGVEASTLKQPLGALAEHLCQENAPVTYETTQSGRFTNLLSVKRALPEIQVREDEHSQPLTDSDIPFAWLLPFVLPVMFAVSLWA